MKRAADIRAWVARLLVAAVFAMNVWCAVQFCLFPADYVDAYQVQGPSAQAMVQSIGICFLMWNATYPPVIARPRRYRVLFGVAIAQQAIGLVGEALLRASLGVGLATLSASIARFIAFDAFGLVALCAAFLLTQEMPPRGDHAK